ncbi:hypothetical protein UFOVP1058_14 [uncultured Caudovirales phage]|uniref:Uncharacterized protein n=1 Tax=uncultured Caudovirales phage TaxID=2100421 RepID=A0A6J5NH31_9CAUD|nr:hypothetical protein UFOVP656_66 [uncultured Caudovirales phage]CAB4167426.1 hypothetical protein UFOVP857_19 [uncultured Caudovirales phage]CAB4168432.1 hypothetical protein UFOVP879_27 [uncultured Caudovirales phage]CAB4181096.1 hypothetical protein UFOVP1058_14 [uncultured Caudovirales phage]CAB4195702.1 hypothetical protein UFOVP1289_38 [uncultured Caudovirales phage]
MDEAIWVTVVAFVAFVGSFVASYLCYKLGHKHGFAEGEDHALPPRGPKGRFQKTK